MQAVTLKGHKEGFEIILDSRVSFAEITRELEKLLKELRMNNANQKQTAFDITTGMRLLTAEEKKEIEKIVSRFEGFSIHRITADVIRTDVALDLMNQRSTHRVGRVVRNGQVVTIKGDVLFFGSVHQGGILQATGNIYVLGEVQGIVHAGYEDNTRAVIVGDLNTAQQVRIGDVVTIVADRPADEPLDKVVYVSDLHNLESTDVHTLMTLRPKLFVKAGGF